MSCLPCRKVQRLRAGSTTWRGAWIDFPRWITSPRSPSPAAVSYGPWVWSWPPSDSPAPEPRTSGSRGRAMKIPVPLDGLAARVRPSRGHPYLPGGGESVRRVQRVSRSPRLAPGGTGHPVDALGWEAHAPGLLTALRTLALRPAATEASRAWGSVTPPIGPIRSDPNVGRSVAVQLTLKAGHLRPSRLGRGVGCTS
jgi:hypothetical protein